MQSGSDTAGDKGNQSGGADREKEAAYWREQHPKQPYAKNYSYEEFEHAYRTGYDSFAKYPGQRFDEVEQSVAADYAGQTRFSIALGHGASGSQRRLGQNGWHHRSARSRPRCARLDLKSK